MSCRHLGFGEHWVRLALMTSRAGRARVVKANVNIKCSDCGAVLVDGTPKDLYAHRQVCHPEKMPYQCDDCGRRFKWVSSVSRHKRIHSGEKPHRCHVCGRRFTRTLRRHCLIVPC